MAHELRGNGLAIGRRRVARLVRENGQARQEQRLKRTADSLHAFPVAPNLLDQEFATMRPNQKRGAGISHVRAQGWLCLAAVIDRFARRVAGWKAGSRLHKEPALPALRRAVVTLPRAKTDRW